MPLWVDEGGDLEQGHVLHRELEQRAVEEDAGVVGLVVNLISFRLLAGGSAESLNVKGAYLEVLSDLLGSIGVIAAAIVVYTTGWTYADPLIGATVGLRLPRTWTLASQAVRILMEAAPKGMDVDAARERLRALPGVADIHDPHIWTLTSGMDTASVHVVLADGADGHAVLDAVRRTLADDYDVVHSTVQCEPASHSDRPSPV